MWGISRWGGTWARRGRSAGRSPGPHLPRKRGPPSSARRTGPRRDDDGKTAPRTPPGSPPGRGASTPRRSALERPEARLFPVRLPPLVVLPRQDVQVVLLPGDEVGEDLFRPGVAGRRFPKGGALAARGVF